MRKFLIKVFCLGIAIILSACSNQGRAESMTSTDLSVEKKIEISAATPTPIPTYAPGTELYGMLSISGEVVIEPQYEYLDLFSEEGLARFCAHGLWGYVNTKGEEVIAAQYEDANNFSEGLAAVKVGELWGFIDESGKMVIEPQFEIIPNGFQEGRCVFAEESQRARREGLIDESGQVLVDPTYDSITLFSNEYFIVFTNTDAKYGIIDRNGQLVIDMQEKEIYAVTNSGFYCTKKTNADEYDMVFDIFEQFPVQYKRNFQYYDALWRGLDQTNLPFPISLDEEKWGGV